MSSYVTEFVAVAVAAVLAILLLMCMYGCKDTEPFFWGPSPTEEAKTFYLKLGGSSGMNIAALHCLPDDNISPGVFLQAVVEPKVVDAGIRGFVVSQSEIVRRPWIKSTPAVALSRKDGIYIGYNLTTVEQIVQFLLKPPASAKL